ncbi:MAG: transglutaminase-like domain-containing protein [Neptuniibacter sp.]
MTKKIIIKISEPPKAKDTWMIVPKPVSDWQSRCVSVNFEHVEKVREIEAKNSLQHAYLIKPVEGKVPAIEFSFTENHYRPDHWIWQLEDNRYTSAAPELADFSVKLTEAASDEQSKIKQLVDNAAEYFGYAHSDVRFNEGHDEVPLLCGMAKGSCVDINTYLIASAKSIGIKVQYMAGYWFHPEKNSTLNMHCWLAFECEGEPIFWDVAHHLKWGVDELSHGLNPAGGRRVPMTCGRGLRFDTPYGEISISHFSEPLWVLPSGEHLKPELQIHIQE